jgi:hypothetical protein
MLKGPPWGGYKVGCFILNRCNTLTSSYLPLIGKNPKQPMLNVEYVMIIIACLPFQHNFIFIFFQTFEKLFIICAEI